MTDKGVCDKYLRTYIKSQAWLQVPVIPALGAEKPVDPESGLASQHGQRMANLFSEKALSPETKKVCLSP